MYLFTIFDDGLDKKCIIIYMQPTDFQNQTSIINNSAYKTLKFECNLLVLILINTIKLLMVPYLFSTSHLPREIHV